MCSVVFGIGVVLLFCFIKILVDDFQILMDLSVFNGEWYKDVQYVVIWVVGEKNQVFIVGVSYDFGGEFGVWFVVIVVFKQFNGDYCFQFVYVVDFWVFFGYCQ